MQQPKFIQKVAAIFDAEKMENWKTRCCNRALRVRVESVDSQQDSPPPTTPSFSVLALCLLDGAAAAVAAQLQQHERARNRLSGVVLDHLTARWSFEEK